MSKNDKLKEQYIAETDAMASKSRFGYFSLLPSHTAAHTDFPPTQSHKQSDGKVSSQPRNIYGGASSTGSLRKNYFSYVPSPFHGSTYQDPGKHERKLQLQSTKEWAGKDTYKPAKLNKTLTSAPYPYMSPNDPNKGLTNHRNPDGKVIIQSSNILTSPQSKIDYNSIKQYKYTESGVEKKIQKITKKAEDDESSPFKTGSPHKEIFSNNYQVYFDADIKKQESKANLNKCVSHEGPFKPSCISKGDPFTQLRYTEEGTGKPKVQKIKKSTQNKSQPFKLTKVQHNSKPCPSISLSKTNLLRICR